LRKILALLAAFTLSLGLWAAPAEAVTNGTPDTNNEYPFVGLMVAQGAGEQWRCSGTLIPPPLFVTAGHCTAGAESVQIWFDGNIDKGMPKNGYPTKGDASGRAYTHPQYDPAAFSLFDLGVVVLDKEVYLDAYGVLPGLDSLDKLKPSSKTLFTAVGYGLQQSFPDAASWKMQADRIRMISHPYLLQINGGIVGDSSLLLSNNANSGGTCFGDSGGPNFVGDTNIIAGVTSFGMNSTCSGTGGVYRIDRADDLDWLATIASQATKGAKGKKGGR
jgi:hypothetical protein